MAPNVCRMVLINEDSLLKESEILEEHGIQPFLNLELEIK